MQKLHAPHESRYADGEGLCYLRHTVPFKILGVYVARTDFTEIENFGGINCALLVVNHGITAPEERREVNLIYSEHSIMHVVEI